MMTVDAEFILTLWNSYVICDWDDSGFSWVTCTTTAHSWHSPTLPINILCYLQTQSTLCCPPSSIFALQMHNTIIFFYCSPCFLTMLSASNSKELIRITHNASKMTGLPTPNLSDLYSTAITCRARTVANNPRHPSIHSSHCFHLVTDTEPWHVNGHVMQECCPLCHGITKHNTQVTVICKCAMSIGVCVFV